MFHRRMVNANFRRRPYSDSDQVAGEENCCFARCHSHAARKRVTKVSKTGGPFLDTGWYET